MRELLFVATSQIEDALQAGQHLRLLPQLVEDLGFLRSKLRTAKV